MICPCTKKIPINLNASTAEYSDIEITLIPPFYLRVRTNFLKEPFESQETITLPYCPLCGKQHPPNQL